MSPRQSRNIFLAVGHTRLRFACPPAVPPSGGSPDPGRNFLSIAITLHCMDKMDETADGFLVMARQRFFNQAGRRPSTGLLLTDWLVFDRVM